MVREHERATYVTWPHELFLKWLIHSRDNTVRTVLRCADVKRMGNGDLNIWLV